MTLMEELAMRDVFGDLEEYLGGPDRGEHICKDVSRLAVQAYFADTAADVTNSANS